jgi:hypothetical protein
MDWEKALRELQDEMAIIDIHLRAPPNSIQRLVKQHKAIRLRMDTNLNHKRPHVHVDYGRDRHVASYAIDTGERLVGNLNKAYDGSIRAWIAENRVKLLNGGERCPDGGTYRPACKWHLADIAAGEP